MKSLGVLATILVLAVITPHAQAASADSYLLVPPPPNFGPLATVPDLSPTPLNPGLSRATPEFGAAFSASVPALPTLESASIESPVLESVALSAVPASALPSPAPAPMPQGVYGVFPSLYWQFYAGYSYLRFYEFPGTEVNTSGFEASLAYYLKDWMAAEGEFDGGFGSQLGETAKFVFAGGGLRARWQKRKPIELWAHALAGVTHFLPRVSYGGPSAFGYEIGAGADFDMRRKFNLRLELDGVGTAFFSTYQLSPKISMGIVYNF